MQLCRFTWKLLVSYKRHRARALNSVPYHSIRMKDISSFCQTTELKRTHSPSVRAFARQKLFVTCPNGENPFLFAPLCAAVVVVVVVHGTTSVKRAHLCCKKKVSLLGERKKTNQMRFPCARLDWIFRVSKMSHVIRVMLCVICRTSQGVSTR